MQGSWYQREIRSARSHTSKNSASIGRMFTRHTPRPCLFSAAQPKEDRAVAYLTDSALDRNIEHALSEAAERLTPVTVFHPDDFALLEGRLLLPSIRVHDHDWKPVLADAIAGSKVLVFYLGSSSDGAKYEIERSNVTDWRGEPSWSTRPRRTCLTIGKNLQECSPWRSSSRRGRDET
jgi:hypothetical protein